MAVVVNTLTSRSLGKATFLPSRRGGAVLSAAAIN
jgi:hypothetical protein